jgi:hypothetical protein
MNKRQMFQTALKHQNQPGWSGAFMPPVGTKNGCSGPACSQAGGSPQATDPFREGSDDHDSDLLGWVDLSNKRAEREFDFLVQTVGKEKIIDARALLGSRKAFPLNLARILGVRFPAELSKMPAHELKEKIQGLRRRLGSAGGGVGVQREGRAPSTAPAPSPHSGVPDGENHHA